MHLSRVAESDQSTEIKVPILQVALFSLSSTRKRAFSSGIEGGLCNAAIFYETRSRRCHWRLAFRPKHRFLEDCASERSLSTLFFVLYTTMTIEREEKGRGSRETGVEASPCDGVEIWSAKARHVALLPPARNLIGTFRADRKVAIKALPSRP